MQLIRTISTVIHVAHRFHHHYHQHKLQNKCNTTQPNCEWPTANNNSISVIVMPVATYVVYQHNGVLEGEKHLCFCGLCQKCKERSDFELGNLWTDCNNISLPFASIFYPFVCLLPFLHPSDLFFILWNYFFTTTSSVMENWRSPPMLDQRTIPNPWKEAIKQNWKQNAK